MFLSVWRLNLKKTLQPCQIKEKWDNSHWHFSSFVIKPSYTVRSALTHEVFSTPKKLVTCFPTDASNTGRMSEYLSLACHCKYHTELNVICRAGETKLVLYEYSLERPLLIEFFFRPMGKLKEKFYLNEENSVTRLTFISLVFFVVTCILFKPYL